MCYSYKTEYARAVGKAVREIADVHNLFARQGGAEHASVRFYARSMCPVITLENDENILSAMHWDLIPSWYMKDDGLTIEEVIKKKATKKYGFSSFNARSETINSKPAFRNAWRKAYRCLFPASSFFERPNRKDRPDDFPMQDYEIEVLGDTGIAGLYDVWTAIDGKQLKSCSMVTTNGVGHPVMDSIYHNRIPLMPENPEAWLNDGVMKAAGVEVVRLKSLA